MTTLKQNFTSEDSPSFTNIKGKNRYQEVIHTAIDIHPNLKSNLINRIH